ncbi:unnamed protein product [Phytophthora lilii]|uniref:Unnamed protein product n=1 Tax=Phytophthora lilii TaxID=2077276 RepID=A0A9W7CRT6_9STRA|nr:unnamed protein product [Phytophthora lilii]
MGEEETDGVIWAAVRNGGFELTETLLLAGNKIQEYIGHLILPEAVEPMLERGYLKDNKIAAAAAIWLLARENSETSLDLMKRVAALHPKPPRGTNSEWLRFWEYAMTAACEGGDISTIKWLMDHPTGRLLCKQMKKDTILDRFDGLLQHAAKGGHVEAMTYLVDKAFDPHSSADRVVLGAAKLGHLNILKFLHAPRYATQEMSPKRRKIEDAGIWWSRSREAMDEAAYSATNGQLEVVKWLFANRPEGCLPAAMDGAARNGYLEVMKWLEKYYNGRLYDASHGQRCSARPFKRAKMASLESFGGMHFKSSGEFNWRWETTCCKVASSALPAACSEQQPSVVVP